MSDQEKNASVNPPVGSNQSDLGEDLQDVSTSKSQLVGVDTKSLKFAKTLMDDKELDWMVTNQMVGGHLFVCLEMKQFLIQSLMNVCFFEINLQLDFVCRVKTFLKNF